MKLTISEEKSGVYHLFFRTPEVGQPEARRLTSSEASGTRCEFIHLNAGICSDQNKNESSFDRNTFTPVC
jgi:hypothetical protein